MKASGIKDSPKTAGTKLAAKKAAPRQKKVVRAGAVAPAPQVVSATTKGGYQVFGSMVSPKHVTLEQIAEAIASID